MERRSVREWKIVYLEEVAAHSARVVGVQGLEVVQQTGRVVANLQNNIPVSITDIGLSL